MNTPTTPAPWALSLLACALLTVATPALSKPGGALERIKSSGTVRVCVWPDYYGISLRNPRTQKLQGLDVELAGELAKDLGVKVEWVDSSFPKLIEDINTGRCDVAMFGVGMLPARTAALRFTQPYLQSDIYGVTTRSSRVIKTWADIDQPGVNVAVQAGTFMEPVMGAALKQARMVIVKPPTTREQELESGRVDVFMTDYPYSRRLLDNADWARLVSPPQPFHVLQYGYPVKQGDEPWAQRMSAFVATIKRDGRLQAAAQRNGLADIVVPR
jgi:cyclohexadienyl dehydratase